MSAHYKLIVALCLLALLPTWPAAATSPASLEGLYAVQGWEPGGDSSAAPDYDGHIRLTRQGASYRLEGKMDDASYVGVGLMDHASGMLSLMFESQGGKERGATAMKRQPDGSLRGFWINLDSKDGRPGIEVWTRQTP